MPSGPQVALPYWLHTLFSLLITILFPRIYNLGDLGNMNILIATWHISFSLPKVLCKLLPWCYRLDYKELSGSISHSLVLN